MKTKKSHCKYPVDKLVDMSKKEKKRIKKGLKKMERYI